MGRGEGRGVGGGGRDGEGLRLGRLFHFVAQKTLVEVLPLA